MSSIRDFIPLQRLGEGTFSTVYKVRRESDQKIYALKKVRMNNLSQKQKENALNEIRILASFDCSNIVAYKQAFFDDKVNILCIVMQFADGGDLHNYINKAKKDYRKISQITIWKVAADILCALDHLHSKGILHRDLKSANIFIHGDQYKLGDLNVSKVNGGKMAYTQTGTPYYASPQVWRDQPYDNKSDIWSFGCILYEMASLKPPFQGKNMDELYKSIQKTTYPTIPQDYSIQLAQMIDQCLQKNPKNRPKASQLLDHIVISRFKNRKNVPIDENQTHKQLLRTIKLPNDLRNLKMNLPSSKYDDEKKQQPIAMKNKSAVVQRYDIKNFVSDRPNYQYKSTSSANIEKKDNPNMLRNHSHVVTSKQPNIQQQKAVNHSQLFLSPRNIKKSYQQYSLSRSPQDLIAKKIASAHINNSQKKSSSYNTQDYTDRKNSLDYNYTNQPNYSDRRVISQNSNTVQKKSTIIEKYDKFIKQQLQKKPAVMPRTEKRIVSSQGRYQSQNPYLPVSDLAHGNGIGVQKKQIEEWRKKLVKKSRVFSNNIFLNRPVYGVGNPVK